MVTCLGETLADGLEDGVVLNVIGVVGLELGGNAGEGALQGLLGRSVDHLGLNTGIIGRPCDKGNLVAMVGVSRPQENTGAQIRMTYRIPSPEARLYSKS